MPGDHAGGRPEYKRVYVRNDSFNLDHDQVPTPYSMPVSDRTATP